MTGRNGTLHDQALIHERMADLYLEMKECSEARYRLEKATELYSEWKADKKVTLLQRRLKKLTTESDNTTF